MLEGPVTPLPGFFLCGDSVFPGIGINGIYRVIHTYKYICFHMYLYIIRSLYTYINSLINLLHCVGVSAVVYISVCMHLFFSCLYTKCLNTYPNPFIIFDIVGVPAVALSGSSAANTMVDVTQHLWELLKYNWITPAKK